MWINYNTIHFLLLANIYLAVNIPDIKKQIVPVIIK